MRKQKRSTVPEFDHYDVNRLEKALQQASDARVYVRIHAVLLLAQGLSITSVVQIVRKSRRVIYYWMSTYLKTHQPQCLYDAPRKGRPRMAPAITAKRILKELKRNPLDLGYNTNIWTVATLSSQLSKEYECEISPFTLYRRMKQIGLRCKRPKYVYSEKEPNRAQKKG